MAQGTPDSWVKTCMGQYYNSFINQLKIEDCNLKMIFKRFTNNLFNTSGATATQNCFYCILHLLHVPFLTFQSRTKI